MWPWRWSSVGLAFVHIDLPSPLSQCIAMSHPFLKLTVFHTSGATRRTLPLKGLRVPSLGYCFLTSGAIHR
jgi:hypothetical protein